MSQSYTIRSLIKIAHKEKSYLKYLHCELCAYKRGFLCIMNIAFVHRPAVVLLPLFLSREAGMFVML